METPPVQKLRTRYYYGILLVLVPLAVLLFSWIGYVAEEQPTADIIQKQSDSNNPNIETYIVTFADDNTTAMAPTNVRATSAPTRVPTPAPTRTPTEAPKKQTECSSRCETRRANRMVKFGVDLVDRKALVETAKKEKQALLDKLHVDYGKQYFEDIFVQQRNSMDGEQRYKGKVPATRQSTEILKQKLMIKILSMQLALAKKDSEAVQCDCLNGEGLPNENNLDSFAPVKDMPMESTHERYVWATGGHSAAAGHGNMYNESYTAYMERDLKPFFASLGIDFEARNYAMGGTSSAFEVSTCYEQIFGSDVDFFSWDYGMIDSDEYARILHYGYKGALSPGRPVMMANHVGGKTPAFQILAEKGLAVFLSPMDVEMAMKDAIPDCALLSDAQIQALPEYVRNLKCEGKIESGDPYCKKAKYTKYYCEDRALRTHWHPGFKANALDGHVMSLFLMEHLMDALQELSDHKVKDPTILLEQLKSEDDRIHQSFASAQLQLPIKNDFLNATWDAENVDLLNWLYRGRSMCRTGRLPARSRFLGYMTNNGKTGGIAPLGHETYETGIELKVAVQTASDSNTELRLVYENDEYKQRNWECTEQVLSPDYRDFYFVHANDGWTKLSFPNELEKAAYRYDASQFKGILAFYLPLCGWGKCLPQDIRGQGIKRGQLEVTVNGQKVKSFMKMTKKNMKDFLPRHLLGG